MILKTFPNASFNDKNCHRFFLKVDPEKQYLFFRFLQKGFFVRVQTVKSIRHILCNQFDLEPGYVLNRIKTIFYNGKPVDDLENAIVEDSSTLALSAAMPGLVGATFRSGGVLSPFRASISYRPEECNNADSEEGIVQIKLFNLLIPELGPGFLKRGIFVKKTCLDSFIIEQNPDFWSRCRSVTLDDSPVEIKDLIKSGIPGFMEFVYLKVTMAQD
jgi:hypothetical protein